MSQPLLRYCSRNARKLPPKLSNLTSSIFCDINDDDTYSFVVSRCGWGVTCVSPKPI